MVKFRNAVDQQPLANWWQEGDNQIAFSRNNLGFVAFNMEKAKDLQATIQTGLAAGTYCDILTGTRQNNGCTGSKVVVNKKGEASLILDKGPKALAIYEDSRL